MRFYMRAGAVSSAFGGGRPKNLPLRPHLGHELVDDVVHVKVHVIVRQAIAALVPRIQAPKGLWDNALQQLRNRRDPHGGAGGTEVPEGTSRMMTMES